MPSIDPRNLACLRLAQTIEWCAARADPAEPRTCLRSPGTAPRVLARSYRACVEGVALRRGLRASARTVPFGVLSGGRLLAYFPDGDLSCGTADSDTDSYFDVHSTPPWYTWVRLIEDETADSSLRVCLVCWVPPLMLERAAVGVEVNPEGCIRWLDDCRPKLRALWEAELSRRPAGNR